MDLDLFTTINIYMFVNYVCTITLGIAWYRIKDKYEGILFIFIDFVFQSIGLTLASHQSVLSPIFSVVLANVLMYIGSILLLYGVGQFIGISIRKFPYFFSSLIFICLYGIFTFYIPNTKIRLIVFTSMILPVFIHTAYIILFKADHKYKKFAFHVANAHILFAFTHGLRAYIGLNNFSVYDYNQLHQSESKLIIISLLLMIYLSFSVTQMIHMKLLYQLDQSIDHTKHLLLKTQHLATTDNLTQIYNRGKIEEILEIEINIFCKYDQPFSILIVDIDHFKQFNDAYGHDFGDQVLIEVSRLLQENLREADAIGRWGGEEFLIVLKNSDLQIARSVGQKLIDRVSIHTLQCGETSETITISVGCSEMKVSHTLSTLIKSADTALYSAKNNGRNRIESSS